MAEGRGRRAEGGGQDNIRIFNIIEIELSDFTAVLVIVVKVRQLRTEDCCLDLIETGIKSFVEILILGL